MADPAVGHTLGHYFTLDINARSAAELVGRLINPVLAGEHHGTWDPTSSEWTDEPHAGTT